MSKEYETIEIYRDGYCFINVDVAEQDGYHVAGVNYYLDKGGNAWGAGRKWGQFSARKDAILWALGQILTDTNTVDGAARKAVQERILTELQPTLF